MNKSILLNKLDTYRNQIDDKKLKKISNMLFNKSILDVATNTNVNHNHLFSIDLIGLPVEDQGLSKRSLLYSATNLLRDNIAKSLKIKDFSLSNSYLSFWDKIERSNYFLEMIIENIDKNSDDRLLNFFLDHPIYEHGYWDMVINLIEKYGVVPFDVMPDTYHSTNPKDVNYLLNWKLKEFANILRTQKDKSIANLEEIKKEQMNQIYKILKTFYGNPVKVFDFQYCAEIKKESEYDNDYNSLEKKYFIDKNITPQDFYKKYVNLKLSDYVSIINVSNDKNNLFKKYKFNYINNIYGTELSSHINLNETYFKYLIINELIKNKKPILFSSDPSWYVDKNIGCWDNKMFCVDKLFDTSFEIKKTDELFFRTANPSHNMLIMGVNIKNLENKIDNLDLKNEKNLKEKIKEYDIDNWKVHNSWGCYVGDWGYFSMSDSWFDNKTFPTCGSTKSMQMTFALTLKDNHELHAGTAKN